VLPHADEQVADAVAGQEGVEGRIGWTWHGGVAPDHGKDAEQPEPDTEDEPDPGRVHEAVGKA
jgi:hypothetical protein